VEAGEDLDDEARRGVRFRPGEGIVGRVLQMGEPLVIPSLGDEPAFCNRLYRRQSERLAHIAFICVPVGHHNEVVGTLSADIPHEVPGPLEEKLELLTILARMIAYDVSARREEDEWRQRLEYENLHLRDALGERFCPENIIGNADGMRDAYMRIQQVAHSPTTVLIRGESGTGKELVANAIHYGSDRSHGPFVKVNCAALNDSLLESELFGHEKGAFTGALHQRIGRIEETEGGTLFLDEIGDFSPAIQVKMLRVLQEREYQRVGSNETQKGDVRIIAATNRDLEDQVKSEAFRHDLYYRINVFPIWLPPLWERRADILLLADYFVARFAERMNKPVKRITTPAINALMAYHWPGNVRELENCIEHAMLLAEDNAICAHNLPPTLRSPAEGDAPPPSGSLTDRVAALESDMISDALKRSDGNIAAAARELGITSRMVRYKMKAYGISAK